MGQAIESSGRLTALDAFRGATILLMVLVNDAGGPQSYPQLEHAEWHGLTLTDTVFPSFLWIVGVALTLSLSKRLAVGCRAKDLLPAILRRSAILFALGMFSYLFPHFHWGTARILGVLQRIAICYLAAALIYLWTGVRGQLLWLIGLLVTYWLLMTFVPVPVFGAGRLDVEGNFAHYIDFLVLGRHNYAHTLTWDPEGIVSTLPAIATTLFGVMAGHFLRLKTELTRKIAWLFFTGCLLVAAGLLISNWMPLNKKLWTDSFSVLLAGIDFLVFGCFLWFADELKLGRYLKLFVIVGMNSIAVYLASELLAEVLNESWHEAIFNTVFAPYFSPQNASLAWALVFTGLLYLFAYVLYRRRWFWRI